MKLYHFADPTNYAFAQASILGTWYPENSKPCPECHTSQQERVPPLLIEWEPGSDVIGDFIWPNYDSEIVVVQFVKDALKKSFQNIKFLPIEFWQNPKLKQPEKINRRSKPRVWLPYKGTSLWNVVPKKWVHLDHASSGITLEKVCSTCELIFYNLPERNQRHLVVDPNSWNGEDIFHIHEYSGGIFCTEHVKEFVEKSGFTNVKFSLDGEIPTA